MRPHSTKVSFPLLKDAFEAKGGFSLMVVLLSFVKPDF